MTIRPLALLCPRKGSYTIYLAVGAQRRAVATDMPVRKARRTCKVKHCDDFVADVSPEDTSLRIELHSEGQLVASGGEAIFAGFENLHSAEEKTLVFAPQTLR